MSAFLLVANGVQKEATSYRRITQPSDPLLYEGSPVGPRQLVETSHDRPVPYPPHLRDSYHPLANQPKKPDSGSPRGRTELALDNLIASPVISLPARNTDSVGMKAVSRNQAVNRIESGVTEKAYPKLKISHVPVR